ncbi:MAG TPA: AMP-binding protein [Pseudonocardiaceae bacterium]|jgi:phenylacetate-CoA ligase
MTVTQDIADVQRELLRELLATVAKRNPFYRHKIHQSGFDIAAADIAFGAFPFTTKAELIEDQRRHPPYGTNLSFPIEDYTRYYQTSGTSATPMRWLDTHQSWTWMLDSWAYMFQAMGVTRRDRVLAAFSFGPFLGFWTAFECAQRMGCLCFPGGGMNSEARLRMLADNEITVLLCTPTYAVRLGQEARKIDGGSAVDSVRRIIVAGEPGGSIPATRNRLAELWPNATVLDHYGTTETGPVAYQLPDEPGNLRTNDSAYLVEIIDPETSRPVDTGEVGELVLTGLGRLGSPLLRYRTGDLVRRGAPDGRCPDRMLAGGVIGRADDMVVVRGVNIYPSAVESVLHTFPEIVEFRVTQLTSDGTSELEVEVELDEDTADVGATVADIGEALRSNLLIRFAVRPVGPGALPRFDMKARRWSRR